MPRPATTPVTMASSPQTSWPCPSNASSRRGRAGGAALDRAGARLVLRLAAVDRPEDRLDELPERERLVDRACCLVATCSPGVDADDRTGHPSAPCPRRGDTTRCSTADRARAVVDPPPVDLTAPPATTRARQRSVGTQSRRRPWATTQRGGDACPFRAPVLASSELEDRGPRIGGRPTSGFRRPLVASFRS